jgi:copper chaperone CopZ
MHCGYCEVVVKDAIRKVDGVQSVKLNRHKNRALVAMAPGKEVSVDTLIAAVNETGYRAERLAPP